MLLNHKCFYVTVPPEIFDPNMKMNKFLLFLNAHGISHKVCKLLKGER